MENLIPIDPETFGTMKPGTMIYHGAFEGCPEFVFMGIETNIAQEPCGIMGFDPNTQGWEPEKWSFCDWYRKPEPAPVVEFSGESYYVSSEETDVEIICSGSVGYSLYDRSVMGCIDVPGNYTIKIYKTEDLK